MKLGLYHKIHEVADGEVTYRDISIEGPRGIIRTSPLTEVETCTIDPITVGDEVMPRDSLALVPLNLLPSPPLGASLVTALHSKR